MNPMAGGTWESIGGDKLSLLIFWTCILLILAQVSLILVSWGKLPPVLPLFYSRVWGEAMLAPQAMIWILPTASFAYFVLNFCVAIFWLRSNFFLFRTLVIFALIVVLGSFYTGVKIISLLT